MDTYKKIIYNSYISTHNKNLYGENSLERIKAYAPAMDYYYCGHIPGDKSIRILDIGCGDGYLVYHLQQKGYENTTGIDLSPEQINKGFSMGIGDLYCADFTEYLSKTEEKFDVIVAKDVIEHFTRDKVFEILPLINSKLNEGGKLIIQVPNAEGYFYTSIFYGDYTHEMPYTDNSISQVMLNTGFSRVECYATGPVPTGITGRIRYVLWNMLVLRLKFWKMIETGTSSGFFTQNIIAVAEK